MASDYSNPVARQQIAASSFSQAAPLAPPKGLEQLSSLWTAPFGRYAPPYIRSNTFGYLLSAMFGVGLITTAGLIVGRFTRTAA
jgi:cobalt/nickel transport system permease protein